MYLFNFIEIPFIESIFIILLVLLVILILMIILFVKVKREQKRTLQILKVITNLEDKEIENFEKLCKLSQPEKKFLKKVKVSKKINYPKTLLENDKSIADSIFKKFITSSEIKESIRKEIKDFDKVKKLKKKVKKKK